MPHPPIRTSTHNRRSEQSTGPLAPTRRPEPAAPRPAHVRTPSPPLLRRNPARRVPGALALLVVSALAASAATSLFGGQLPARAAVPAEPNNWTTVWGDDFTGAAGTAVNGANWMHITGTSYPGGAPNFGTGEVETMTSSTSNVALDGAGHVAITPIRDGAGNWTSGRIETQRTDFAAPAGGVLRVEASIQQPNVTTVDGAGYWPAFWMLGDAARPVGATNWPSIGEIDILEDINGRSSLFGTLHCGTVSGGPCNETTGIGSGEHPCPGCQTGFHTYAMEYDRSTSPEQIRWYLDGAKYLTVNATQVDPTTWANATQHGFFLILNVAMGGAFPAAFGAGTPTAATVSGRPMLVDYVTVSTKACSSTPPTITPTATPTATITPSTTPTPTTAPPTGRRDPYATIQAESHDAQSGTLTEPTTDTGGGSDVTQIADGDWLAYGDVDFGATPATQFLARVASGAIDGASGLVEVRLDSPTNAPVGTFAIADTGGWQNWRTVPANISPITGVHQVYLTFTSHQPADFVNLNWLVFTR